MNDPPVIQFGAVENLAKFLIIIKGSELCFSREDEKLPATAQLVSAEPDVSIVERDQATDQFICLACDGIYDVFSNDDLANYINSQMSIREELEQIATEVIDTSLHKVGLIFWPSCCTAEFESRAECYWESVTDQRLSSEKVV